MQSGEKPKSGKVIDEWLFASDRSPLANPAVATDTKNIRANTEGEMNPRLGYDLVSYSNDNTTFTDAVIAMFTLHRAEGDKVLYLKADGDLQLGKVPS